MYHIPTCIDRKMSFPIDYTTYTSPHTPSWLEYLTTWQQEILHTITNEVLKLHTIRQKWLCDGDGIGLGGAILDDVLFHCQLTYTKSMHFLGRQRYIDAINSYILAPPREYDGQYSGICAAVIGSSGVGKTSLIANVAVGVYNIGIPASIPTIVRYCGINKESNDGYSLMKSITSQLLYLYDQSHQISSFPRLFEPAKQCFQEIISLYPAIIFLDALNQLSDMNNVRSNLSFLRGAKLSVTHLLALTSTIHPRHSLARTYYYSPTKVSSLMTTAALLCLVSR